jgi:hypothetical protein
MNVKGAKIKTKLGKYPHWRMGGEDYIPTDLSSINPLTEREREESNETTLIETQRGQRGEENMLSRRVAAFS